MTSLSSTPELWAVVPVKPFTQAKSRLASILSPVDRALLSRSFLRHVLDAAQSAPSVAQIVVVSRDAEALHLAEERGLIALSEEWRGLNQALAQATRRIAEQGAGALLILPTDLPLVEPDDIEALWALALDEPAVVIAPARRGGGTNALLVRPPGILSYRFGPGSFNAHCAQARAAGIPLFVVRSPHLALDVDSPDDLAAMRTGTARLDHRLETDGCIFHTSQTVS